MEQSVLRGEIAEQPETLARFLEREGRRGARLAAALAARHPRFVLVAARGTSDNAGRYAQYALGICARLPVGLAAPSLGTVYGRPPRLEGALVVGISQSGRSPDICETVADARRQGADTLAIVNDTESPLARAAAEVLPLHVGEERSIAATKTYTAQLAAVALLALHMGPRRPERAALFSLPDLAAKALRHEGEAARAARLLAGASGAVVLARGVNFPTAFEAALKLKEMALLLAEPMSAADFQHGPLALSGHALPVVLVSPPGAAAERSLAALGRLLVRRGSPLLRIGGRGKGAVGLPDSPELLSPIPAAVACQLLALHAALARGVDPDRPQGLKKVTETR